MALVFPHYASALRSFMDDSALHWATPLSRCSRFDSVGCGRYRALMDTPHWLYSPFEHPPCANVREEQDEATKQSQYVMEVELPGVKKEDITVQVTNAGHTLTVKAETRTAFKSRDHGCDACVECEGNGAPQRSVQGKEKDTQAADDNTAATPANGTASMNKPSDPAAQSSLAQQTAEADADASRKGQSSARSYQQVSRSVTFPVPVNTDAIKATYVDGVLKIVAPTQERHNSQQIAIE